MNAGQPVGNKEPMMVREVARLDKAIEGLRLTVEELRSALEIPEGPTGAPVAMERPQPGHRIEIRAIELENLTSGLNHLGNRLAPVLDAVREI